MRVLSSLAVALIAVSACSTSPPELPPDSPSAMHSVLTNETGDDFLERITTYEWDDGGAAAGERFTWVGGDPNSDGDVAPQATQVAAVLAEFLIAQHTKLMGLDSGFLGLSKSAAAHLNPALFHSYATALAPYLSELVGGQQRAFDLLRTQVADDPLTARNLLSVFVPDPDAGRTIITAAQFAAGKYIDATAAAPPDSDESVADLRAAGSLLGAAYGSVKLAGSDIPTPTSGGATNEMAVRLASILVPSDPNPAKVSKYVQDGKLMTPAEVESRFSTTAMRTYFLDLLDYLSTDKGFGDGVTAFHRAFMASSGVPAP
jgi:hypothetical protein